MDGEYRIVMEEAPDPADMAAVSDGLREYNRAAVGPSGFQRVAMVIRDAEGALAGGLLGGTYWGWLHVDTLWVREDLRQHGYGSALLRAAEAEALSRGVGKAYLDTFSFQALGFYLKHGYAVFGQIDGIPEGHSQYFLSKVLGPEVGVIE